jgi:glyoxylase-like metal-dependent hydrolase (beta-lactamase superfamily II)
MRTTSHIARVKFLHCFLAGVFALFTTAAIAQQEEAKFGVQKVTDNITMLYGAAGFTGGNIAVSTGPDGVAVIDNGMPNVLGKLRDEIAKITDQPVDYLINTHIHGDHTGNNQSFGADGTTLISHRNLRFSMVKKGVGNGEEFVAAPVEALPVITFNDEMTLNLNGDALRLIHQANAHTDGDAMIQFQKSNVIHTGDVMFNGLFPYIDTSNGGSLDGVIAALSTVAKMSNDETKIIPGHGPLATKADVEKTIAMLKDSKQLVATLVSEGKTDEEILAANPLEKYSDYHWGFITTERMTNQLIAAARAN